MIISNLADYGVLADTIEVVLAVVMMLGGIWLTHRIQVWADSLGEHPAAANVGLGGAADRTEENAFRR